MKISTTVLVFILVMASGISVSAKRKHSKHKDKAPQHASRAIGSAAHPVFGDGRQHPVYDDKVIGKFKNADEIRAKVKEIDELDKDNLKEELEEISEEAAEQKKKLGTLREQELAKIQERKSKLVEAKALLEKQGVDAGIAAGLMNKLQVFVNDTQMKQVKSEEQAAQARVNNLAEKLRASELLESYLGTKLAN